MEPFFIITDYNHLPQDLSESWIPKYAGNNYLLYDRADRWSENENIKKQKNVGENIYDMFDFIVNNYENLPEIMVFVKADVIPRHCSEEKFSTIIKQKSFSSIENYKRNLPQYKPGQVMTMEEALRLSNAYVNSKDGYMESVNEVNYTLTIHPGKYFNSYQDLLNEIFENPEIGSYIRFAPGGNYLVTRNDVLKYNKHFYETAKLWVSWDVRPGEAFLFERGIFTLFSNKFVIKEKYKSY